MKILLLALSLIFTTPLLLSANSNSTVTELNVDKKKKAQKERKQIRREAKRARFVQKNTAKKNKTMIVRQAKQKKNEARRTHDLKH